MFLEKFDEFLTPKRTKYLLLFSIILFLVIYPLMGYAFLLSENPGDVMSSQLSFSAEYMRAYYKGIGNLEYYRLGETLDYGFMISYGSLIVALALILARKFEESSKMRQSGYFIAILGIAAAGLDAVENMFILLMLTDPSGFLAMWALANSTFALIKWILLFIAIGWALVAVILKILKK